MSSSNNQNAEPQIPRGVARIQVEPERRQVRFTGTSGNTKSEFTFGPSSATANFNTNSKNEPPHATIRTENTQITGPNAIKTHVRDHIQGGEVVQMQHPRLVNPNVPHARVRTEHTQVMGPQAIQIHPRTRILTGGNRVVRYSGATVPRHLKRVSPSRYGPTVRISSKPIQAPAKKAGVSEEFVFQNRIELLMSRIQAHYERLGIQDDGLYDDVVNATVENYENFEQEKEIEQGGDAELAGQTTKGLEDIVQDIKNQIHLKTQNIRALKVLI